MKWMSQLSNRLQVEYSTNYKKYENLLHTLANKAYKRALASKAFHVTKEDIFQEMSTVYVKALKTFNPDKGFKFSTYLAKACWFEFNKWFEAQTKVKLEFVDTNPLDNLSTEDSFVELESDNFEITSLYYSSKYLGLHSITRSVIQILQNPPKELVEELNKMQLRYKYGNLLNLPNRKPSLELKISNILRFLNLNQDEKIIVSREIHDISV
jgi:hypothetical protein